MPVAEAIPLSIIGNIVPVPFILLLITPIFAWMKGTKKLKPLVEKLEARAMSKKDQIEKYEFWGLVLFVGIPLPGTGAWTGSLIAALLGIKFKKAVFRQSCLESVWQLSLCGLFLMSCLAACICLDREKKKNGRDYYG